MRKNVLQSLLVALIIALLFPALWVGFLGQTSRSPIIEKSFIDDMSIREREKWVDANSKPVSLLEHIKTLPRFITNHWRGYLQASVAIFIVIFSFNYSYLTIRVKNKP